jgi:hypothetical protein
VPGRAGNVGAHLMWDGGAVASVTPDQSRIKELEDRIADLKSRWPPHSVKPAMWQELEALEESLALEQADGPQDRPGRL